MLQHMSNGEEKPRVVAREERILRFWEEREIFKKSVAKDAPKGNFVFYDGPPFATGLPHYGHLVPGTIKDVIPRFKTMQGYRVERRWGWDTQGVPIEALVQKENNLETKKDIEAFGIKKFTDFARQSIFRYADDWQKIIPRTGRWVDFDDLYITMAPTYTESIWWMWKTLYEKGLVYEGFKSMHVSPPLETALSNFEVNQGYKDITDISVTAKFELVDESNTFVLAWTTTPWTLPGNVALAVNKELTYVYVEHDGATYIVSKDLVAKVFAEKEHNISKEISGEELLGKAYKPVYDFYATNESLENRENGWKIYHADFVTTEDGTGIVHIAPAFGEDDLLLGQQEKLPFVQHVHIDGTIKDEITPFAGLQAKPTDDPTATDVEVIKDLAHRGLLFSKEKYTHSYPHCYRTDAPLLNYAMSSWFIKVTDVKDKLVAENDKVNWTPDFVGKARFGNWLKEAKDWAVSRARYWGTPIPVWKSEDGTEVRVIGSLDELKEKTKSTNTITLLRHGEAEHNIGMFAADSNDVQSRLTEQGKIDVRRVAEKLKQEGVDIVYVSPLERATETATIVAEVCGLPKEKVVVDDRITETQTGFSGKPIKEYRAYFKNNTEKFTKAAPGGETLTDLKKRVGDFLYDLNEKHTNEKIVIISHEYPIWLMMAAAQALDVPQTVTLKEREDFVLPGETIVCPFSKLPHNDAYELDFHRPYIDDITFVEDGKTFTRIPEVFDTWIDSGSVPYASNHYPFEQERFDPKSGLFKKAKGYPADFIAEGLDQTRGWFYSMLVLNTILFGKAPYKNVVVNGLLLAEDGRKMSKRLKNYPEMSYVLDTYGADALRYFLMASPLVRAEEAAFSEKGVDEVMKKLIGRLDNVVTFYEMYATDDVEGNTDSTHVLDQWIISRFGQTINEVTNNLESYQIDKAARPLMSFVDDVSTWYIRRSRDRFKSDDGDARSALATTRFILENLAKLLAPFTPFVAEDVYQRVRGGEESVHLAAWPDAVSVQKSVLADMEHVRDMVTKTLELRTSAGIKVRQPLQTLTIKATQLEGQEGLIDILKDEVNVKDVQFDKRIEKPVALDLKVTETLKQEGDARELIRFVQTLRKKAKFSPDDVVTVTFSKNVESIVVAHRDEIAETVKAKEIRFKDTTEGDSVKLHDGEAFAAVAK